MPHVVKTDEIARMSEDLERALAKPVAERSWGMVIDLLKCIGCDACTISCKSENKTPPGVSYNVVLKKEIGEYPNVRMQNTPRPCMQCGNPPCVKACPVDATWKRPDGIVVIDYQKCIGCRYCMVACPYGARYFDFGETYTGETGNPQEYEDLPTYEYMGTPIGQRWPRTKKGSPVGNVRKCHFCVHRLNEGLLPACIGTCVGRARYFGDFNDPESLVSELVTRNSSMRIKEDLGTEPSVHYLT